MTPEKLTESLQDTLAVFERCDDPGDPLTTNEVTEHLDISRRSTYTRLEKLVEQGYLKTKKVGARGRIWWQPRRPNRDEYRSGPPRREGDDRDQEHDLLTQLMAAAPIQLGIFDSDGSAQRLNPRARRPLGADSTAPPSCSIDDLELYDAEGNPRTGDEHPVRPVIDTGAPVTDEVVQYDHADGSRRWAVLNATPLFDAEGTLDRVIVAARDVTDLKRTERELARQRDELASELSEVFERVDDAFYAVDDEFRFTYVNDRAEDLLQHPEEALLGKSVWEVFPEARETEAWDAFHEALETQEPTGYDLYYEPLEFWIEARVYPSESGLSVYFRDVSERKERERELERYETVVENIRDGVYMTDADRRYTMVNDAYLEMIGMDREEVLGAHVSRVVGEAAAERSADVIEELLAGEREAGQAEGHHHGITDRYVENWYTLLPLEDGAFTGTTGVVRDITERKEREQELQTYETIVETVPDAVYMVDAEGTFEFVNYEVLPELTGLTADELEGRRFTTLMTDEDVETSRDAVRDLLSSRTETEKVVYELAIQHVDGTATPCENHMTVLRRADGEFQAAVGVLRDITDRKERERELVEREQALRRTYEIIADRERSFTEQVDALLGVGRDVVGTDYATFSSVDVDDDQYVFEAVDVPLDVDLEAGTTVPLSELPNCEHVVETEQTLVLRDVEAEAPELADPTWDIGCYLGTPVVAGDEVYGTFCFYSTDAQAEAFSDWEVTFVELLGNWVGYELERQQQADRLAALNDLNRVVREVTDAVIAQSTREEIERAVCDHLAAADSYEFAWIAEVDSATGEITPRVEAGADGYLDSIDLSTAPDDPAGRGPVGRAFRTGEMQISRNVFEDPTFEPWRDAAERYGFQSVAVLPISHEETRYGILAVHSARAGAFDEAEREVVGQLGEIVGHVIASVQRKQALLSDEVVELQFRIPDVVAAYGIDTATEGRITLEEVVPVTDEEFLVYGTATDDAIESVRALVAGVPHWDDVTFYDEVDGVGAGVTRFELRLTEPPVLSTLASLGGSLEEVVVEDGNYHMRLHHPPNADTRRLVETIQEAYPSAEMVAQRQLSRPKPTTRDIHRVLGEELTDRQRTALEVAYHSGFFEWPRNASGEDLAESLGVSPPTYHQHLRAAEKKVFESLFDTGTTTEVNDTS